MITYLIFMQSYIIQQGEINMKKILFSFILLLCACLLTFTACDSGSTDAETTPETQTVEPIVFQFESNGDGTCKVKGCEINQALPDNTVTIPNKSPAGDTVVAIRYAAFDERYTAFAENGITKVVIPDSVKTIEKEAFLDCTSLTTVIFGKSVETIGEKAFKGCTGLTSVSLTDSLTTLEVGAFKDCSSLATVTLPEKQLTIFEECFDGTAIYRNPQAWNEGMFFIGRHLIKGGEDIAANVVIPSNTISMAQRAFENNHVIKTVTITGVKEVAPCAFLSCPNLTTVTIKDGVEVIGGAAFQGCVALTAINMGEGVTTIESFAFYGTTALKEGILPLSLTKLGTKAFYCEKQRATSAKIQYPGSYEDWDKIEMGEKAKDGLFIEYGKTNLP